MRAAPTIAPVRALVLDDDGLPQLSDVPEPNSSGVLVRVRGCGLCGSDVEKLGRWPAGSVLGHEIEGELEDGTRVTVIPHLPCGDCERCRSGHESTCDEFRANRIQPGGFAEYLRASYCVPLPDEVGELAGIYVEPLACVLRALDHVPRGRLLVVGCGSVGLLWIQALARRGDVPVASDVREDRLAFARDLGAGTDVDPVPAAVVTAPGGLNEAIRRVEPGGIILLFAADPDPAPVALDAIYRKELSLVGSRSPSPPFFTDAIRALPSFVLPEVRRLPLERFAEGLDLYRRGEALKIVFTP
jgi:L-iditol 2-dehydrogenase